MTAPGINGGGRTPRWDERARSNPVVVFVGVVVSVMVCISGVQGFFTSALPWLLTFVGPLQAALGPPVDFLSKNATIVGALFGAIVTAAFVVRTLALRRRVGALAQEAEDREALVVELRKRSAEQQAALDDLIARSSHLNSAFPQGYHPERPSDAP